MRGEYPLLYSPLRPEAKGLAHLGGSDAADRGQQNRPDRSDYGNGRRLFCGVATS